MKLKHQMILAVVSLIFLLVLAYSNTFAVPFLFDDIGNVLGNISIRQLWPPWQSFVIPENTGINNRFIINFSLAINYAISGYNVYSYHLVNLIIHILATLTLFGIVHRTVSSISTIKLNINNNLLFSFTCALLWGLHPVQTQAVTYIIQRCESLMSLFFLLTFYSALRGWQAEFSNRWHLLAVMFFILAVGSKEVAIVCPILLLSYEWVFQAKNPLRSIKESPYLYGGLFLVCIGTFVMVIKGNTLVSRVYYSNFTQLDYWTTQCEIIFHYMRLAVWPYGLTFDYGWPVVKIREVWPFIIGILLLLGLSVWALLRRKVTGFLGMWFFLILAPTSLLSLSDMAVEHRMYLPLAAIIILVVGISHDTYQWLQRKLSTLNSLIRKPIIPLLLITCVGLTLCFLTYQRNYDYRSAIAIWSDTISKRPNNYRAYQGVGVVLLESGQLEEALKFFLHAQRLNPKDAGINNNIGYILLSMNKPNEAIFFLREAIRISPGEANSHYNIGVALVQTGKFKEGIFHFYETLKINPDDVSAKDDLIKAIVAYKKGTMETGIKDHRGHPITK